MKRFLLALALTILPALALADAYVAKSGNTTVRVTDAECTNPLVRAQIGSVDPDALEQFRAAHVTLAGQSMAACWMAVSETELIVVLEDGRGAPVPIAMFRKEPRL